MSDKEEREDGLKELNESMLELDVSKKTIVSPQLQQFADGVRAMSNAVVSAIQSDAMRMVINIGGRIAEMIASINFEPMLKKFSEAMIPFHYINILERLKWPVFLIDDESLREKILLVCSDQDEAEKVKEIIFAYFTDDFLKKMEDDWCNCKAIAEDRKPILSEAMMMHKQGFYYASTSILMCQVYGIASDIVDLAKRNGLEVEDEEKDFVSEYFEIKREDIDKEKGRLLQMVVMTESGQLLWDAMASYLKEEILCSSDSKKRWATQPLRNKICHGDQLNFGTKEHSLKAILTIDMLIQLAYEINRIIRMNTYYDEEKDEDKNNEFLRCI